MGILSAFMCREARVIRLSFTLNTNSPWEFISVHREYLHLATRANLRGKILKQQVFVTRLSWDQLCLLCDDPSPQDHSHPHWVCEAYAATRYWNRSWSVNILELEGVFNRQIIFRTIFSRFVWNCVQVCTNKSHYTEIICPKSPWREISEEVLRGVDLLEAGHPAQVVRELLQLVVIQLEGDQAGQRLERFRYVLRNKNIKIWI